MQKTLTVNGKKFTAKQIVATPKQETNGGDYLVKLNGERFFWNYRQSQDEYFAPVCDPEDANCISLMRDDGSFKYSIWLGL